MKRIYLLDDSLAAMRAAVAELQASGGGLLIAPDGGQLRVTCAGSAHRA